MYFLTAGYCCEEDIEDLCNEYLDKGYKVISVFPNKFMGIMGNYDATRYKILVQKK